MSTAMGRMLASLLLLIGLMLPAAFSHAASAPAAMASMPGMTMGCDTPAAAMPDMPRRHVSCQTPAHHAGHAGHAGASCCAQDGCAAAWLPAPVAQAPPALHRVASALPRRTDRLAGRVFAPGLRPPRIMA